MVMYRLLMPIQNPLAVLEYEPALHLARLTLSDCILEPVPVLVALSGTKCTIEIRAIALACFP
jgi:hypothetical protein